MKRHRDGAFNWRQVPVRLTDKGVSVEQPAKIDDDENDSTRGLLVGFGPIEQTMTQAQKLDRLIPHGYHKAELAERNIPPDTAAMTGEIATWLAKRTMNLKKPPLTDQWGQPLR